jgi:hypothetical protein
MNVKKQVSREPNDGEYMPFRGIDKPFFPSADADAVCEMSRRTLRSGFQPLRKSIRSFVKSIRSFRKRISYLRKSFRSFIRSVRRLIKGFRGFVCSCGNFVCRFRSFVCPYANLICSKRMFVRSFYTSESRHGNADSPVFSLIDLLQKWRLAGVGSEPPAVAGGFFS